MKFIIVVLLIAIVINANSIEQSSFALRKDLPDSRIIHGGIVSPGEFPWQVLIRYETPRGYAYCGGALICDGWVLTAAHCLKGGTNFTISLGTVNISQPIEPGRINLKSIRAVYHRNFRSSDLRYDVGLIKLSHRVIYKYNIQPIALFNGHIYGNVPVYVSGWGRTSDYSGLSHRLRYTMLQTITNDQCKLNYAPSIIKSETLCCTGLYSTSTCRGDSGGALVAQTLYGQTVHVGIVSFVSSKGCELGTPSGYTRTGSHLQWIRNNIDSTCMLIPHM